MRKISMYRLGHIFASAVLLSLGLIVVGICMSYLGEWEAIKSIGAKPPPPPLLPIDAKIGLYTAIASLIAMIVSMVGTASTMLIGWRSEHRQSEEFKLKNQQLALQIEELKLKLNSQRAPTDIST
jgi:hypothetical protein